jgi:hypothetical protein
MHHVRMRAERRPQLFPHVVDRAAAVCAALVAVLSVETMGVARAQTPAGAPVSVLRCDVRDGRLFNPGRVAGSGEQELDVTYRNDGPADLRLLTFMLTADDVPVVTVFAKTGTLAGATGSSAVRIAQGVVPLSGSIGCRVSAVDFAGGTTWRDPTIVPTSGAPPVQTPGAPLTVQQCDLQDPRFQDAPKFYLYETLLSRAPVTATRVDMSLFAGRDRIMTFGRPGPIVPGAPTRSEHTVYWNVFPLRDLHLQCRIDRVEFADGTTWQNPAWPEFPWDTPQTPGAHVDVLRCSGLSSAPGFEPILWAQTVFVDFRNTASVVAAEIDFAFGVRGKVVGTARARGSYAPNVLVSDLGLRDPSLPYALGTELPACFVTHVEYADGTSWNAPQQ